MQGYKRHHCLLPLHMALGITVSERLGDAMVSVRSCSPCSVCFVEHFQQCNPSVRNFGGVFAIWLLFGTLTFRQQSDLIFQPKQPSWCTGKSLRGRFSWVTVCHIWTATNMSKQRSANCIMQDPVFPMGHLLNDCPVSCTYNLYSYLFRLFPGCFNSRPFCCRWPLRCGGNCPLNLGNFSYAIRLTGSQLVVMTQRLMYLLGRTGLKCAAMLLAVALMSSQILTPLISIRGSRTISWISRVLGGCRLDREQVWFVNVSVFRLFFFSGSLVGWLQTPQLLNQVYSMTRRSYSGRPILHSTSTKSTGTWRVYSKLPRTLHSLGAL